MKISIGIDPGISGGVAVVNEKLEVLGLEDVPTVKAVGKGKTLYNAGAMADILRAFALKGDAVAVLEAAAARPGQGVSSMFSIGRGFGLWEGLLSGLGIPFREVHPATWTRAVLKGVPGEGKERNISAALKMFPGAEIIPPGCRKPKDGRADALLLAYYGLRN